MSENKIIRTEYGMCPKCNGEGWVFETGISTNITKQCGLCNGTKFITSAIESALNDTVVEKSFDAIVREMNESHARYIADNSPVKLFTESEVDAIRADTWKAAREQNGFDSLRWTSFDAYLTSLNLNTNDTGKEDIRDNKINLLEEDLAVVHHYLDDLSVPRKHEGGDAYSIVGRIKQLELYYMKKLSEIESEYLSKQQPTNDNAFWNDATVKEFIQFGICVGQSTEDAIWHFKQSKQSAPEPSALPDSKQEEKQWEIVSLHHKNDSINKLILSDKKDCYYWSGGELNKNPLSIDYVLSKQDFIIHSVRRFPDNSIWSVKEITYYGVIEKFVIQDGFMHVHYEDGNGSTIQSLTKLPTPTEPVVEDKPVLFTTEDGVGIKEGQLFWYPNTHVWKGYNTVAYDFNIKYVIEINKYPTFSTPEASEQYILENKPCLSVKDILKEFEGRKYSVTEQSLKNLAKQKLNHQQ